MAPQDPLFAKAPGDALYPPKPEPVPTATAGGLGDRAGLTLTGTGGRDAPCRLRPGTAPGQDPPGGVWVPGTGSSCGSPSSPAGLAPWGGDSAACGATGAGREQRNDRAGEPGKRRPRCTGPTGMGGRLWPGRAARRHGRSVLMHTHPVLPEGWQRTPEVCGSGRAAAPCQGHAGDRCRT